MRDQLREPGNLVEQLGYAVPALVRQRLQALELGPFKRMLDLGCGTGLTGGTLRDMVDDITGIDISENMVELAHEKDLYETLYVAEVEDFLEEYVRDARVMRDGQPTAVPVFSDLKRVQVDGAGEMESFLSDGLRTLIETMPEVPNMSERTLRWPGHVHAIRPLVASGAFVETLRRECVTKPENDLVAMVVYARWKPGRESRMTLVDRYDAASGLTAMARTTALTTSVTAQLLADGGVPEKGVRMLEHVGRDTKAYGFILGELAKRGVRLNWKDA